MRLYLGQKLVKGVSGKKSHILSALPPESKEGMGPRGKRWWYHLWMMRDYLCLLYLFIAN